MTLDPVAECQLILSEFRQNRRNLVAMSEFGGHVLHHVVDTGVALVLLERLEQVELRVLLNLHVEVIQGADRSVASQEVVGTRTEADDLQVLQTDDGTGDGDELMDHVGALAGVANGLLGDVGTCLAQRQGMAGVQHAAISVTTTVDEVVLSLLGSGAEHSGAVEVLGQHGLRDLRTEVAQVDAEGVTASLLDVLKGLLHVDLALHDADGALVDILSAILFSILGDNGLAAVNGQRLGETVAAHGHDTNLDYRYIIHIRKSLKSNA